MDFWCWMEQRPPRVIVRVSHKNQVTKNLGEKLLVLGADIMPDFKAWSLPSDKTSMVKEILNSTNIVWYEVKRDTYEDCSSWLKDISEL